MAGFALRPFARSPFAAMGGESLDDSDVTTDGTRAAKAPMLVDGDYTYDDDGNIADAPDPVAEEIAWRLKTNVGSFAGGALVGTGVFRIHVFTSATEVEVRDEVARTLAPMVARGVIRNVVVTPEPYAARGVAVNAFHVTYTPTGLKER